MLGVVSIPYRRNESVVKVNFVSLPFVFQFLIGAMKGYFVRGYLSPLFRFNSL